MAENYHHGDLKNALIQAGLEILAEEGMQGMSLRKVAKRAGVSHAAPYGHFPDKQALVAAISTRGYEEIYGIVQEVAGKYADDPVRGLVETAGAYMQFAIDNPEQYKATFSGIVEKEKDYPDFVEVSKQNLALVVERIIACQAAGAIQAGDAELLAINVWGSVHGLIMLYLENQISGSLLEKYSLREMLIAQLRPILEVEIAFE